MRTRQGGQADGACAPCHCGAVQYTHDPASPREPGTPHALGITGRHRGTPAREVDLIKYLVAHLERISLDLVGSRVDLVGFRWISLDFEITCWISVGCLLDFVGFCCPARNTAAFRWKCKCLSIGSVVLQMSARHT